MATTSLRVHAKVGRRFRHLVLVTLASVGVIAAVVVAAGCSTSSESAVATNLTCDGSISCDAGAESPAEQIPPSFDDVDGSTSLPPVEESEPEILLDGGTRWTVGPAFGVSKMVLGNAYAYVAGSIALSDPQAFYEAALSPDAGANAVTTLLTMPQYHHPYSIGTDGQFIYGVHGDDPTRASIVKLGVSNALTTGAGDIAVWSDRIVFGAGNNLLGLRELNLGTGAVQTLLPGEAVNRLTTDAKGIYWVGQNQVGIYDRKTGQSVHVTVEDGSLGRPIRRGDNVYVAGYSTLFRVPVSGGSAQVIGNLGISLESGDNIAVDSTYAYAIGTVDPPLKFRLVRIPIAGGPVEILHEAPGYGRSLASRPGLLVYVAGNSMYAMGSLKPPPPKPTAGPPILR